MTHVEKGRARIRDVSCHLGELSRADGCARYSQGGTAVLCSVTGPQQAREYRFRPDRAVIEVVIRGRDQTTRGGGASRLQMDAERAQETAESHQIAVFLQNSLESVILVSSMPRQEILFTIQVLEEDGGLASVAINAAMLAVLDSGLPCKSMVAGVEACITKGQLLLDPTEDEIAKSESHALFVHMAGEGGLVASRTSGTAMSTDNFWLYHKVTKNATDVLFNLFRKYLHEQKAKSAL
eukprot:Sspe_Gene.101198::Locus_75792_Transcript_1_1_Confidence_1.000_Length_913::g.101198::m.101198/K12590/RRP46, EXOSC5; exosome complex component RRP46